MADAPPPAVNPWNKDNKDYLQKLHRRGKVNLSCEADTDYIDRVRQKYFRERGIQNFCRNFRTGARTQELEDTVSGARQGNESIIVLCYSYFC